MTEPDGPVAGPVTAAALEPLRERYARWLGLDPEGVVADREEAQQDIRAMQLVLRMERGDPPSWHGAVAAAASGAALLCLDPRSEPGGEWYDAMLAYCTGHIRKVTRRARASQWEAVGELPSVLVEVDGAQVRAVLPGRVDELDKRLAKLQVGGTDAPVDPAPPMPGPGTLRLWIPPEPTMTLGKSMAQAGHAGMIAAALLATTDPAVLARWAAAGAPAVAHRAGGPLWDSLVERLADPARAWDERLLAVRDAGFTEIAPGTVTVVARAPE